MTRTASVRGSSRLRSGAIAYVAIAFAGTAILLTAVREGTSAQFVLLLWLLYLGPIGIVADVFAAATGLMLTAPGHSALILDTGLTLLFTGAASLNVLVIQRLRRIDGYGAGRTGSERRVLTGVVFAFAGAAFVVLTFLAGFFFLTAYGVDVPTPEPLRVRLQIVTAATWLVGLVVAVAGVVVWIRGLAQHRPTLRFAVADLAIVVTTTALVIVNNSFGLE